MMLIHIWKLSVMILSFFSFANGFSSKFRNSKLLQKIANIGSISLPSLTISSQVLADTSISEEEVLNVSGQVSTLPDPIYIIVAAGLLFVGVGALQFSLGDLNKEEAQARVRDFVQTKRDTERNRGYFDDPK